MFIADATLPLIIERLKSLGPGAVATMRLIDGEPHIVIHYGIDVDTDQA